MNKRITFPFVIIQLTLLVCSCQTKEKTLFRLIPPDKSGIEFSNDIAESDTFNILTQEYIYNGGGVGIGDFNNDGLPDVFFVGNMVPNKLYLNKGDLEFQDITETAAVNIPGRWNSGVSVVDINQDGWLDIYVTATLNELPEDRRNVLFVNNGLNQDGIPTFTERAEQYKIDDDGYSVAAAFFDFDLDEDLDLYVLTNERLKSQPSNYRPKITDGSSPNNDRLYRNNGDGTFTDISKEAGILIEGYGLGLTISDLNKDGWPDIYVSNDYMSNDLLYINNRDGTFKNRIKEFIGHQSQFSMGNDVADFNNDSWPDLITLDMLPETNARKKTTIGNKSYLNYINNEKYHYEYQYMRNMLHLNNGLNQGIKFSEIGQLAGIHQTDWSWSPLFADLDNDGYKDLVITNGFPKDITDKDFSNYRSEVGNLATAGFLNDSIPVVKTPNYAFKNSANLIFEDYTKKWGLGNSSFTNGASFADLDNDGDLDYIMNNINEVAFIYENTLYPADENGKAQRNNYLRIRLKGKDGNNRGIGAKITLYFDSGKVQYHEHFPYRGFLSSVETTAHFGLDSISVIDSIKVEWPSGEKQLLKNVLANQELIIEFLPGKNDSPVENSQPLQKIFNDVTEESRALFLHKEADVIDFNIQRTLPHKFSQSGPGIAIGDVNNDGLEDFVIGGSTNYPHSVFLQMPDGKFAGETSLKAANKLQEDEGLLLFDADGDNDLDLYVVSGSIEQYEASESYQDRLFLNNGKGEFELDKTALPDTRSSGSCVRAADFDADGDLDLFVGGRVVPGKYPLSPESYLLRNDNGKFVDVTNELCSELKNPGMITDAMWSDFNTDGKVDLILAGEFTPVMFFQNAGDSFRRLKTGIDQNIGWWNSITSGDFDSDGDIDYVAGNLGLNNSYCATAQFPVKVYAKDFDGNGSIDPIMACYMRESMMTENKKLYPVHFWNELNTQSPKFRQKYSRYRQYSKATMEELLTPEDMENALVLEANHMATSYIENKGDGQFSITALPVMVQVAPVNGMLTEDVNSDGNLDVIMVGNDFGNEVFAGRYDAFTGLVLTGDGQGNFTVFPSAASGFYVAGDAKALAKISTRNKDLVIATQNRDSAAVFTLTKQVLQKEFIPAALDCRAEFTFDNGRKQRVEFYYGSGYLSQSTRKIRIPANVREMVVYDSKGNSRTVVLSAL